MHACWDTFIKPFRITSKWGKVQPLPCEVREQHRDREQPRDPLVTIAMITRES